MTRLLATITILICSYSLMAADLPTNVVLVVHGGAGAPDRDKLSPEEEKLFRNDIQQALKVGYEALKSGSSLDAVEAAIKILEDSPRYNAGKGAVFVGGTFTRG